LGTVYESVVLIGKRNIMRKELEKRLIDFATDIIEKCKNVEKSYISDYLTNQILRSSSSAALNYGEAQSAVSKKDFIHKISVVLKELRETNVNLKLMINSNIVESKYFEPVLDESEQLVSIFYRTMITAKKNN